METGVRHRAGFLKGRFSAFAVPSGPVYLTHAMCGRFTQMMTWSELHDLLGGRVTNRVEPETIYDAAPTMAVLTALPDADVYVLATMVWGVEPEWASSTLINAQGERYTASGRNFWAQFKRWLDPEITHTATADMLEPYSAERMRPTR